MDEEIRKAQEEPDGEGDEEYDEEMEMEIEEEGDGRRQRREKPETIEDKVYKEMNQEAEDYFTSYTGRYVPGYRHYENYESYSLKYPERTIQDYVDDVNRECTFEEYFDISITALRYMLRLSPKVRMEVYELTEGNPERIEWILNSSELRDKYRDQYNTQLRKYYQVKNTFKLVDALEQYMEMMFPGDMTVEKFSRMGNHNYNSNDMISFQKFFSRHYEPEHYGVNKMGPTDFPTPFKSVPSTYYFNDQHPRKLKKQYGKKIRRMQGTPLNNMRFFSTAVARVQHTLNHPIAYLPFVVKK